MSSQRLATAIRRNPLAFLTSRWPYQAAAFVALTIALTPLGVLAVSTVVLLPIWGAVLAWIDRRAVALVGSPRIPEAGRHVPFTQFRDRVRARLAEPLTWRESGYALLHLVVGIASFALVGLIGTFFATGVLVPLVLLGTAAAGESGPLGDVPVEALVWAVPLALASFVLLAYLTSGIALGLSSIAQKLLSPRAEALQQQVSRLARSNALVRDEFDARLRDLERQIHDGAQIRIATAAMHLGLLEHRLRTLRDGVGSVDECLAVLDVARSENEMSLDSLRESLQGLRPRVLQESGLVAAIEDVAQGLPLRATVRASNTVRLPVGLEYSLFQIAQEAVTNAAKHAGASSIDVTIVKEAEIVTVTIRDDGRGGANPYTGTGIIGMQERTHLLGGVLRLSSPTGGPTIVTVSAPIRLDDERRPAADE